MIVIVTMFIRVEPAAPQFVAISPLSRRRTAAQRVRIAKRDGDAGETNWARDGPHPSIQRSGALQGAGGSRSGASSTRIERSELRARGAEDDGSSAGNAPEPGVSFESRALAVEPAGVEPVASSRT
jgi:hypothetical protein